MIRTILVSIALLLGCTYVQSTWLGAISVFGVTPDLGLVVLIWVSYKNGLVEGPVSGFAAGLAEDFLSAAPPGFNAFLKTLVASSASLLHGVFYIDRLALPFALGALGTIEKALGAAGLALLFPGKVASYDLLGRTLWVEAAYNGLVAPILFFLLSLMKRALITERGRE